MTATASEITRLLPADELAKFGAGQHRRAHRLLGAHPGRYGDGDGTRFAVWAPNADAVAVVGDFNGWNPASHPLTACGDSGVWASVVAGVDDGMLYKYAIIPPGGGSVVLKADPYGRRFELRPRTAAIVTAPSAYRWRDAAWLRDRPDWRHAPMSIYEVHAGSWRHDASGRPLDYRRLADELAAYVVDTGYTHVELMPVTEYPLDESWGYQCTGYFAPTVRYGEPDDLRYFVDTMHAHRIGVILDWVPGHFPRDDHALSRYDGTALYEHADPKRADTPEWDTLKFNFARHEVRSFLVSSAIHWLEEFHIDGLRVDAVASMLYLDYGHQDGGWLPNAFGGREDLEAVDFLRNLNEATHAECPGTVTIAEESTDWPGVSRPAWLGGLGFSMKWDMGWMHDSLDYLHHEPVHRHFHHDELTFGLMYAHSENFVLPLSHDEVVHGKGSLYARMPGDAWRKHANLRLLYAWQFTRPGKKLLFMGGEFAARDEWDARRELDWALLADPACAGMQALVSDLNRLYRGRTALHAADFEYWGFEWIDCHDAEQSVLSYLRRSADDEMVVVLNFTPVPRYGYRVGAPSDGYYRELLNTDAAIYGGSNVGNLGGVNAIPEPWMNRSHSLHLTLPPLGAVILAR